MAPKGSASPRKAPARPKAATPKVSKPAAVRGKSALSALAPDDNEATPRYLQLARKFSEAIAAGQWRVGEALPAERLLCESLQVSRVTLRMALEVLVKQGLLARRQGAGTFVRSSIEHTLSSLTSFSEVLRRKGYQPGTRWLARRLRPAHGEEILRLGLSPEAMTAELIRLRSADGKVMAYERAIVPQRFLPEPERLGDSLYAYLDQRGTPVVRALQHFKAVNLDAEMAKHFELPVGTAVLRVLRIGYAADGAAIELTDTYCHSDYYDFVAELTR